jgi:NTE family protein
LFSARDGIRLLAWLINLKWLLLVALIPACGFGATAAVAASEPAKSRPSIGLVLSGGGARGASHIGVLKVLEQLRVPVDIITGTSMGAIVGGMYAYGYSVEEIEQLLRDTDWDKVFQDEPPRKERSFRRKLDDYNFLIKQEAGIKDGRFVIPKGLLQGQQLILKLKSLTVFSPRDFDELPIRFRAVAADIENGEAVVLGHGSLATAMLASMAIPGVLAPVEWDGRLLIDGGMSNNVPVRLAREMGADILIVVDLSGEPRGRDALTSPFSILNQILGFTIQRNTAEQLESLGADDVLLRPDLGGYSSTDFWRAAEMIDSGVTAAELNRQRLEEIAVSESAYEQYQQSVRRRRGVSPRIGNIVIDNRSPLDTDVIKSHIHLEPGDELDISVLEEDIDRLHGLNIFERVDYDIVPQGQRSDLIIEAKEKEWGPHYMRFGLNMESDFEGSGNFNFATSYTMTPINGRGGEWRTEVQVGRDKQFSTELYQPIDKSLRYYVRSALSYSESHVGQFESGKQVADVEVSLSSLTLGAGRHLGHWGQVEIAAFTGVADVNPYIGDLSISSQETDIGGFYVSFGYDLQDSINFPRYGSIANVQWLASREEFGADYESDEIHAMTIWANTWNKHTLLLWFGVGGVTNNDAPADRALGLGGLFGLSGYHKSELTGRYAGIARAIYFKEIGDARSVLKVPVYIGGSLEAGNVWNERDDIRVDSLILAGSLSLSIDSPIGPIYFAQGFAEGGRTATYLYLGRTFSSL